MGEDGLSLSSRSCKSIAHKFFREGNTDRVAQVLERMTRFGWVSNSISIADLVDGNKNFLDLEDSNNLIKQMV